MLVTLGPWGAALRWVRGWTLAGTRRLPVSVQVVVVVAVMKTGYQGHPCRG